MGGRACVRLCALRMRSLSVRMRSLSVQQCLHSGSNQDMCLKILSLFLYYPLLPSHVTLNLSIPPLTLSLAHRGDVVGRRSAFAFVVFWG